MSTRKPIEQEEKPYHDQRREQLCCMVSRKRRSYQNFPWHKHEQHWNNAEVHVVVAIVVGMVPMIGDSGGFSLIGIIGVIQFLEQRIRIVFKVQLAVQKGVGDELVLSPVPRVIAVVCAREGHRE